MRTLALTLTTLTLGAAPALAFQGDGIANQPPVCNSNGPYVFEANNTPGTTTTDIVFSSAGTFDPDGDALTYFWFEECPVAFFVDPTSATPTMTVDMAGQCSVTCKFELRVFANGQSAKCFDQFTVQDTLPPVLAVPVNVSLIYGDDTSPGATGTATATDNADPAPVVTYSDVYTPNPIANGFEGVITRTWTATDYCGHVTTGVQLISLFSPAQSGGTNFDFKISSCPNVLDRGALGTANLNLLSTSTFNAAKVDSSTLTLQRRFPTTGTTMSLAGKKYTTADYGKVTATDANLCNSSVKDKKIDFRITLPESEIVSGLGLANEAPGTVVEIAIVGRLTTGQYFFRRDFLTVQ